MTCHSRRRPAVCAAIPAARCWLAIAAVTTGVVLAACSSSHPLMPSPQVYVGADARPLFTAVPVEQRLASLDLLYLTNRAPAADPAETSPYGSERSASLGFGSAIIEIGKNLDWDSLSTQSVAEDRNLPLDLHLGRVDELGRFPPMPYALARSPAGLTREPAVVEAHLSAATALQAEIVRRLAVSPRKELVLFIHGYNNPFEDAAFTISELCHFLGREFVCAMFSWPAGGTRGLFFGYNVDRESAEFSEQHLKQTIRLIAETPGLERLHLIAHSRGTDLLVSVAEQLMIESYVMGEPWLSRHRIANLVLLAPDIDGDIATAKIFSVMSDPGMPMGRKPAPFYVFAPGASRVSIYTSPDDRALSASQWLFGSLRRLGRLDAVALSPEQTRRADPLTGIFDFIQVSGRTDVFGHSYFTSNPAVSADLIALLRYGVAPGTPGRPLVHVAGPFWRLQSARPGS